MYRIIRSLLQPSMLGPTPGFSNSLAVGWDLKIYVSNKIPGVVAGDSLGTTFCQPVMPSNLPAIDSGSGMGLL